MAPPARSACCRWAPATGACTLARARARLLTASWWRGTGRQVEINASRGGESAKREIVELINVCDPDKISLPGRAGDFGLGNPFKFPYVAVEAVQPLGDKELAFVNDTNFGSTGRNPTLPDYSDLIVVKVPDLR